jgi:cytochrome c nitrite reductase small subunit
MNWIGSAALLSVLAIGTAVGLGGFTFFYAEGASYLRDDPNACGNCHVMNDQLASWDKSSHHAVATCNDCHAPHDTVGRYLTKADNGWRHALAFTTGDFEEPIRITDRNRRVTEAACRHCHQEMVEPLDMHAEATDCLHCHESVGHLH